MPSLPFCMPRFRDRSITFEHPLQLGKKKKALSASDVKTQLCQTIQAMPLPPEILEGNFKLELKTTDMIDHFQRLSTEEKAALTRISLSHKESYNLASRLNAFRIKAKKKDTEILSAPGAAGRLHAAAAESYGKLNPYEAAEMLHNLNQTLSGVLTSSAPEVQDYFGLQAAYNQSKYPEVQRRLENAATKQGTTLKALKKTFPYLSPQHSYQSVLWLLDALKMSFTTLMNDRDQ